MVYFVKELLANVDKEMSRKAVVGEKTVEKTKFSSDRKTLVYGKFWL